MADEGLGPKQWDRIRIFVRKYRDEISKPKTMDEVRDFAAGREKGDDSPRLGAKNSVLNDERWISEMMRLYRVSLAENDRDKAKSKQKA